MRFKALALALVALLLLAGCATTSTPETQLASMCRTYAGTLSSLATMRADGELSEGQIASVESFREVGNRICLDREKPASGSMVREMADVLRGVNRIEAEVDDES